MKVGNRLSRSCSAVDHKPVSLVVKTKGSGCADGAIQDFRPHFGVLNVGSRFNVLFRYYEKMMRSLRGDIANHKYSIVLEDFFHMHRSRSHSAEKTFSVQKSHLTT